MHDTFARFLHDETAATAIEYSLILGLVAMAAVAAFTLLGQSVGDMYGVVSSNVIDVMPAGGG